MTDENDPAAYKVNPGDSVALTTTDGVRLEGECVEKDRMHPKDPNAIWEQRTWTIETDEGHRFEYGRLDGLSPYKGGGDAFPDHFQVFDPETASSSCSGPEDAGPTQHGYITDVDVIDEA